MTLRTRKLSPRWFVLVALAVGILIGSVINTTPAGSHVNRSVAHVRRHLAPNFGRVAHDSLEPITRSPLNAFVAEWTHTITPGVANGGVKVDASVIVRNPRDFACIAVAKGYVDNTQITTTQTQTVAAGLWEVFPLTGVGDVLTADAKAIKVEVEDIDICGVEVSGDATSSWFPFGPAGT